MAGVVEDGHRNENSPVIVVGNKLVVVRVCRWVGNVCCVRSEGGCGRYVCV